MSVLFLCEKHAAISKNNNRWFFLVFETIGHADCSVQCSEKRSEDFL